MDKFWEVLAQSSLRLGPWSATGVGVICLTVLALAVVFTT